MSDFNVSLPPLTLILEAFLFNLDPNIVIILLKISGWSTESPASIAFLTAKSSLAPVLLLIAIFFMSFLLTCPFLKILLYNIFCSAAKVL